MKPHVKLSDVFKKAGEQKTEKEKLNYLNENMNSFVKILIDEYVNSNWNLPKQIKYKPDMEYQDIYSLYRTTDKFYMFKNNAVKNDNRRLAIYIQTLESLHPDDAVLLEQIRNKNIPGLSVEFFQKNFFEKESEDKSSIVSEGNTFTVDVGNLPKEVAVEFVEKATEKNKRRPRKSKKTPV